MSKKEPTSQLADFLKEPDPLPESRIETSAESAIRKRIEENGQKKEALEEVKEKLVAGDPKSPDPELVAQELASADATLKAANDLLKAAQENVYKAQRARDLVADTQSSLCYMTDDERNRQYLESQKNLRLQAVQEAHSRYQAMAKAGLLSTEEMQLLCPNVTPLDRAISDQKNMRKRSTDKSSVYRRQG